MSELSEIGHWTVRTIAVAVALACTLIAFMYFGYRSVDRTNNQKNVFRVTCVKNGNQYIAGNCVYPAKNR